MLPSIQSLTLDDVKAYYTRTFRPDMTTMVAIGGVTPNQARRVVEATFGSWKAVGEKLETHHPAVPPNAAVTQYDTPDRTAVQDRVTMAEPTGVDDHSVDRYALSAGNAVLGGGFYAARRPPDLHDLKQMQDAPVTAGELP
jgi:zinc protease